MKILTAQEKKEAVLKVVYDGEKIARVARNCGVARKTLYSWINLYKEYYDSSLETFEPRYVTNKAHPKAKYPKIEKRLLTLATKNPEISINSLAHDLSVSVWTVWNILDKHNLSTKEQRYAFSKNYSKQILPTQKKKEVVLKVINGSGKIAQVAREYGIARKTIYSWIERYKENNDSSLSVFEPRYVTGIDHPRAKYPNIEKRLLSLVAENPELSINSLAKNLPVSVWTVWNILDKNNLNTREQRFVYAEKLIRQRETIIPAYSPEVSFGYVAHKMELLLAVTRKIPKLIEIGILASVRRISSTFLGQLVNISQYLTLIREYISGEINSFTYEIYSFFRANLRVAVYYSSVVLLLILSLTLFKEGNLTLQKGGFINLPKIASINQISRNSVQIQKPPDGDFEVARAGLVVAGNASYKTTDVPSFIIQEKVGVLEQTQKNISNVLGIQDVNQQGIPQVTITNSRGTQVNDFELIDNGTGKYEVSLKKSSELKPGEYTLNIIDDSGTKLSQNFSWGVLVINTDKTVYSKGETADFSITILDKDGKPDCGADLALSVINKESKREQLLTTANGEISINSECINNAKTNKPDYEAKFNLGEIGQYEVKLLADVNNILHTTSTNFEVLESGVGKDSEITRAAPIRVGSGEDYPVLISIKANNDYKGQVTDTLPKNFLVKPFGAANQGIDSQPGSTREVTFTTKANETDQTLIWDVDFKKGSTYSLSYSFSDLGSDWSNYYLGPVTINGNEIDKRWELIQDTNMPVGKIVQGQRYGNLRTEDKILQLKSKKMKVSMKKAHFNIHETPIIQLQQIEVNELTVTPEKTLLGNSNEILAQTIQNKQIKIVVKDIRGNVEFETEVDVSNANADINIPTDKLKPGKHVTTITDSETGNYVEQTFIYGILAINFNKSIYEPGEMAYLQMASLDERGNTDCFSNLELVVFSPSGKSSTYKVEDNTINLSESCGANNVTNDPDYYVNYLPDETGEYRILLTNLEYGFSIEDTFQVQSSSDYSLERVGATRINPYKSTYVMTVNVIPKVNFSGSLTERIPKEFEITNSQDFTLTDDEDYKYITWKVDISGGSKETIAYEYRAPRVSPEVYLFGPAELKKDGGVVYTEARQWQLASDALNTPIFKAAGTFTLGTAAITPPYPTGGNAPVAGDIALLVVSTENQSIALTTANGFVEMGAQANKAAGTAATNPASRLAVYWKRCTGGDLNPVVTDSGDHQTGQIFLFSGVRQTGNPWDVYGEGNDSAANDTTGVIPAATTTVASTLVVLISSTSYNGDSTAEFANVGAGGGWTNANLSGLTEIADQSSTTGLGGGFGIATGIKATAGNIGTTTVTLAHTSYKGAMSIALAGSEPPTISISQPDGTGDSVNNTGDTYNITYTLSDPDDVVTASFYYDTDASGFDGTAIPGACAAAAEGTNATCTWDTEGMMPGDYYVYGITSDDANQATAYSPGVITITGSSSTNTPTFKAAGTFTFGTGAITPPYPTGGNAPAANDIALLIVTSENQPISLTTANGFVEMGAQTNKAAGTAATDPASRLAVYWKRCTGADSAPVVADSGNNTEGQIYIFSGVRRTGNPWDVYGEGNDSAANDTTGVIPAATTTVASTLVVLISSTSYNGTSTAQFANVGTTGGWANSNLISITELGDNTNTAGLGGGRGLATGIKPAPGDIGTTTVTLASTSYKGAMSIALAGKYPSTLSISQPDGSDDTIAEGGSYNVTYSLSDSDITATASFYYDTNDSGLDGTAIYGCQDQAEGTNLTCTWDTTGVSPGTYYVYGVTSDGVNSQVSAYSTGVVTINAKPTISLVQPDGVGDMIAEGANFTVQYNLADADDEVTASFYYDTNDSGLDGTAISGCQNQAEGTNLTCTWNTTGVSPGTYYVYGETSDGVNSQVSTYSSGVVTINATPIISVSQPDGVGDTIAQNANFSVQYSLADTDDVVTANFYYDTNNSGLDGVAITGCQNQAEGTNLTCTWNATGVSPGSYYVYGVTSDGVNPQVSTYSTGVVTINSSPTVMGVSLNGGSNINLTADTTKNISFTATVTDSDGYPDMVGASGKMYRSGVGQSCSSNNNNCYLVASCSLSGCSGNSCTATCTAPVAFFADATDTGSYSTEYWLAWIEATDSFSATGSGTSPTDSTEMNSLLTISTTSNIYYSKIIPGGSSDQKTIVVTNAGNRLIDLRLLGYDMCTDYPTCSGGKITVDNQEYSASGFSYGNGTDLSGSLNSLDIGIPKSSIVPSNSTGTVYWRLGVPVATAFGAYTGSNTIISIVSP